MALLHSKSVFYIVVQLIVSNLMFDCVSFSFSSLIRIYYEISTKARAHWYKVPGCKNRIWMLQNCLLTFPGVSESMILSTVDLTDSLSECLKIFTFARLI